jgi:spore germination cell wall hydrolase CwlJ-like protein
MIDISIEKEAFFLKFLEKAITTLLIVLSLTVTYLVLDFAIENKFQNIETIEPSEITSAVREKELVCLARNIYYEAANEPFEGQVAVAQVTINRVESGLFPNDICKVVYQKNVIYERTVCQCSWYCDSAAINKTFHKDAYEQSMEVAKKVLLEGFRLPSITESLFYHADYINPKWRKQRVAKIGRHIFYK